MTQNQIAFYKARNEKAHYERADLTNRMAYHESVLANRNREKETTRHNIETENLGWAAHAETVRDNRARAAIQHAYNSGYLNELNRSNVARETENTARRTQEMNLRGKEIKNNYSLGRQNIVKREEELEQTKWRDRKDFFLGTGRNTAQTIAAEAQSDRLQYDMSQASFNREAILTHIKGLYGTFGSIAKLF